MVNRIARGLKVTIADLFAPMNEPFRALLVTWSPQ
jgi:hypothetical protein